MRTIATCVFICLALSVSVHAQEFQIPQNVSLTAKEDYAKYEKDIIAAAKWLEATPVGQQESKRQLLNAFLLQWITGSPDVTVELGKFEVDLLDKNPQLLSMFLSGYARYVLENNYSKDKEKATTNAIQSVLRLYQLGGDFKKNKLLQKAVAMEKEGKLEDWVRENKSK